MHQSLPIIASSELPLSTLAARLHAISELLAVGFCGAACVGFTRALHVGLRTSDVVWMASSCGLSLGLVALHAVVVEETLSTRYLLFGVLVSLSLPLGVAVGYALALWLRVVLQAESADDVRRALDAVRAVLVQRLCLAKTLHSQTTLPS